MNLVLLGALDDIARAILREPLSATLLRDSMIAIAIADFGRSE
jgi:hypothetical protein